MKKMIVSHSMCLICLLALATISHVAFAKEKKEGEEEFNGPRLEYTAINNHISIGVKYLDEIEDVELDAEFKNTGNEPLMLSFVGACCGTIVKSYPTEPINPGDTGIIEIYFSIPPTPHHIYRSVSAIYNNRNQDERKTIIIGGSIIER